MKNELPDEQFDQLLRKLMSDAALEDSAVNEIADSPTIWWNVQRRINEQEPARSPWPPVVKRWLAFALPAMAALLIGVFVFTNRNVTHDDLASDVKQETIISTPLAAADQPVSSMLDGPYAVKADSRLTSYKARAIKTPMNATQRHRVEQNVVKTPSTQIKTDFIALTYARDPDSGQLVRVRVPSSMMVTLGLVASVKKPSEMIDAEVLVGDDGLTRAIRFIR